MKICDIPGLESQYQRMKRWRGRLAKPCIVCCLNALVMKDNILAFMVTCLHLGDRLWEGDDDERRREDKEKRVKDLVVASTHLSVCRDLATAAKHFVARSRTHTSARLIGKDHASQDLSLGFPFSSTGRDQSISSNGSSVGASEWIIEVTSKDGAAKCFDMMELVDACILEWDALLETLRGDALWSC